MKKPPDGFFTNIFFVSEIILCYKILFVVISKLHRKRIAPVFTNNWFISVIIVFIGVKCINMLHRVNYVPGCNPIFLIKLYSMFYLYLVIIYIFDTWCRHGTYTWHYMSAFLVFYSTMALSKFPTLVLELLGIYFRR